MPVKGKKSLPINDETHRQIKTEAGQRGIFVSDLVDEMWRRYKTAPASQSTPKTHATRHSEWHDLLDVILDAGSKDDITGIQANLRWGAEAVQKRRPPVKSRAS